MKVTVATLTGEKIEVEVPPESNVKNLKRELYRTGRVSSVARLLGGKIPLADHQKVCDVIKPDTVVSALFEPDVQVTVGVTTGSLAPPTRLPVLNSTTIMALKVLVFEQARVGVVPDSMELRFGDVILENDLPIHFYGITQGSMITVVKPYVCVTIEDNHGDVLYKRLNRKDTIQQVKVKLGSTPRSGSPPPPPMPDSPEGHFPFGGRRGHHHHPPPPGGPPRMRHFLKHLSTTTKGAITGAAKHPSSDDVRLYVIKTISETDAMWQYTELLDDVTVDDSKIKDGDKLFLLAYSWTDQNSVVVRAKTGSTLLGVEPQDTFESVKLRAQDQLGIPAYTVGIGCDFDFKDQDRIDKAAKAFPVLINISWQ